MDLSRGKQGSTEPIAGSPGGKSTDFGNKGTDGAGQGQGSMAGAGSGSQAGATGSRERAAGPGRLTIAIGATGVGGAFRGGYGSDSGMIPGPGNGRGQSPQRQQQGPPAQAGTCPCGPAQTTPLPPVSGQASNETKEENPSRSRFRWIGFLFRMTDPPVPSTAASNPALPSLSPFGFLLFGGYRRILKKNVLDNDARHAIYEAIIRRPGIDTKTLADMTGINENTLRYHLVRLVATGKIASFSRPGIVRYFQNQGAYSSFEHLVLHYLWTGTPREILWMLYVHPGQARQQLADALAISGPSVTRQMEHLIEDGIVENRVSGRSNHYYLTEDAARTVSRLMIPAPVMMHGEAGAPPLSIPVG
jgi:DNA-binding MarR family transcriptional regulator